MRHLKFQSALSRSQYQLCPAPAAGSLTSSLRQFHRSTTWKQEEQDHPAPDRKRRQQDTTQAIQNLFDKTERAQELPGRRSFTINRNVPQGTAVQDLRSFAAAPTGQAPVLRISRVAFGGRARGGVSRGGRAMRGGGATRGGRGGAASRGERENEQYENRRGQGRRNRGAARRGGSDRNPQHEYPVTAEHKAYAKESEDKDKEKFRSTVFEPWDLGLETLAGGGPTIATAGEWGRSEIISETIDRLAPAGLFEPSLRERELADALLRGDFVNFRSEEEKEAVLARAKRIAEETAEEASEETGELVQPQDNSFEPLVEAQRESLVKSLLQGEHKKPSEGLIPGPVGEAMRIIRRNETYLTADEESLMRKLRVMLPSQVARPRLGGKTRGTAAAVR